MSVHKGTYEPIDPNEYIYLESRYDKDRLSIYYFLRVQGEEFELTRTAFLNLLNAFDKLKERMDK